MECATDGITQQAFEAILYGVYRGWGRAQADLDRCNAD
eukprot:COSAG06_NODE_28546_length_572_cov_1.065539_1_plen_38_part_01